MIFLAMSADKESALRFVRLNLFGIGLLVTPMAILMVYSESNLLNIVALLLLFLAIILIFILRIGATLSLSINKEQLRIVSTKDGTIDCLTWSMIDQICFETAYGVRAPFQITIYLKNNIRPGLKYQIDKFYFQNPQRIKKKLLRLMRDLGHDRIIKEMV